MFLALVVLVCPKNGLGAIGLSTLNTGEILLDHLVLLLNAAAVYVLSHFLHIHHLLVVVATHVSGHPWCRRSCHKRHRGNSPLPALSNGSCITTE